MLITTKRNTIASSQKPSDDETFRIDVASAGKGYGTRPVIFADQDFKIVPSLGALHPLHLLICANRKVTGLPGMSGAEVDRLEHLLAKVERIFLRLFGRQFVVFENGTVSGGLPGCSIRQFHMHIVPMAREPERLAEAERGFETVENLRGAAERAEALGDYQLLKLPGGKPSVRRRGAMMSQYLRKRVAEINGLTEWDWRKSGRQDDWSGVKTYCAELQVALAGDIAADATH